MTSSFYANAETCSDVLDDLKKNPDFDPSSYVINQTDFKLEVLQVAEGNDKSLLVYVYQPSAGKNDMRACKIRMSIDGGQNFYDYSLTLLSNHGVFFKYKVDNYVADYSSAQARTYDVVQIVRPASEAFGDTLIDEHNVTLNAVAYPVNWTFTALSHEGAFYYGKERLETVRITDKYCGQLKFSPDNFTSTVGRLFGTTNSYKMLHFIAFNSDIEIEDLRGAKVNYTLHTYDYESRMTGTSEVTSDTPDQVADLSADESDSYRSGIFGHKYTWQEIMSKDDFVNNVVTNSTAFFNSGMTESGAQDIADKRWVLLFATTDTWSYIDANPSNSGEFRHHSWVSDESILELSYMVNGDLVISGVVDNYQTGDGIADNYEDYGINGDWWKEQWEKLKEWLIIAAVVIAVILLCVVFNFFKPVFKVIWLVVSFPFRLIKKVITKRKEIKEKRAEKERNERTDGLSESVDKKNNYRYRRR